MRDVISRYIDMIFWNIRLRVTEEEKAQIKKKIKEITRNRMSICEFTYQAVKEKIAREK